MKRVVILTLLCIAIAAHGVRAQAPTPTPAPTPPTPRTARTPHTPAPAPAPPAPAPAPAPPAPAAPASPPVPPAAAIELQPAQLVNIQLDIKIVEEAAGQPPITKTVTLTVADRQTGSSRAVDRSAVVPGGSAAILNVDVWPVMQKNGRILTRIGLEYQNQNDQPSVQMRAQPLLESGKALRVSRSASAKGDRTVTVDATATILK